MMHESMRRLDGFIAALRGEEPSPTTKQVPASVFERGYQEGLEVKAILVGEAVGEAEAMIQARVQRATEAMERLMAKRSELCPECGQPGASHLGTCSRSMMHGGGLAEDRPRPIGRTSEWEVGIATERQNTDRTTWDVVLIGEHPPDFSATLVDRASLAAELDPGRERELDYFARLWHAAKRQAEEQHDIMGVLTEALMLPPDIEAALQHRTVPLHGVDTERGGFALDHAPSAGAEAFFEHARRGPKEDIDREVREEPQARQWILTFCPRSDPDDQRTVRVPWEKAVSAERAVARAREDYVFPESKWAFLRGETPMHEPFTIDAPTGFRVPLPEETPGDTARLAEDAALNPDIDDEDARREALRKGGATLQLIDFMGHMDDVGLPDGDYTDSLYGIVRVHLPNVVKLLDSSIREDGGEKVKERAAQVARLAFEVWKEME